MRKTIVYIGNCEDEGALFERAIEVTVKRSNFLPLDYSNWSLNLLKKSQPFWYEAIVVDLANLSSEGIHLLKEIRSIEHLMHVPVVVYTDATTLGDLLTIKACGASHYLPKPVKMEELIRMFNALGKKELIPFIPNYKKQEPVPQRLSYAS
ncbi:MAG: response regulator [Bacteroidota bacterium]